MGRGERIGIMKRLTLDQAWTLCLKQWRWIAMRLKAGDGRGIESLKEEWLEKHGYNWDDVRLDCFFCQYSYQPRQKGCHGSCPGHKVDKAFRCDHPEYTYDIEPLKFYAKLLELNKRRKK